MTARMSLIERAFAIQALYPFHLLRPEELLVVAHAVRERRLAPGQLLCPAGGTVNHLYLRVAGQLVDPDGTVMQPVVGTTLLLTSKTAPFAIHAGPEGYLGLMIPRGKFFTLVNQCPALLVGFFQMPLLGVDVARRPAGKA